MIDFHCHLDLYPDALKLIAEVNRRNSFTFVVTTSPRAYKATSQIFADYLNVHVGLGFHPEVVEAKASEEILLLRCVAEAKLIGEIGLDGSPRFKNSLPTQERIFELVVAECARRGGRIMSIHSRGAEMRVLEILSRHPRAGVPVLHWFSGSLKALQQAITLGCWFSVGPAMLRSAKGRQLAARMPIDRVLPETDGPFTFLGREPMMPWQAWNVCEELEVIWGLSTNEIAENFQNNLDKLRNLFLSN